MDVACSKGVRERLFEVIELSKEGDKLSHLYDLFMMIVIMVSLIPLVFKEGNSVLLNIDRATALIFMLDYLLRVITADKKLKRGRLSFLIYPFTPMALIDLFVILPTFTVLDNGLKILKVFRLFRTFRIFKSLRYSKSLIIILDVIRSQKKPLIAVCSLAIGYVLISALVVFNIEPDTFNDFFEAIYWATISLTTMGYGDIYPVTLVGRLVTMISSFIGIAIVALPAGIITAGYMDSIRK